MIREIVEGIGITEKLYVDKYVDYSNVKDVTDKGRFTYSEYASGMYSGYDIYKKFVDGMAELYPEIKKPRMKKLIDKYDEKDWGGANFNKLVIDINKIVGE